MFFFCPILAPVNPTPTTPAQEAALSPADAARAARRAKRLALARLHLRANVRAAETLTSYINGDVADDRLRRFNGCRTHSWR